MLIQQTLKWTRSTTYGAASQALYKVATTVTDVDANLTVQDTAGYVLSWTGYVATDYAWVYAQQVQNI